MNRTQEMFNYLNEFCGKSITSKLFSLKTNETDINTSFESNDIQSFKRLENILEKYIEYKKNKVFVSDKEIEPIKKVLKELKEEIWDEKLMDHLKMLSTTNSKIEKGNKSLKTNMDLSKKQTKNNDKSQKQLQSLSNLKTNNFNINGENKLSKTQKIMKNFYKYVELERKKSHNEIQKVQPKTQKESKEAQLLDSNSSLFNQGFPIFEIKSKNVKRRQSLKDVLHKRDFIQFVKDTPKKDKKVKSKYILSPYHSLMLNKGRNDDLLEDLFRNK
jgi:hypothetical protein